MIYLGVNHAWLSQLASALWRCCVFTAGTRHRSVRRKPGGVEPVGVILDTTALKLHRVKENRVTETMTKTIINLHVNTHQL